MYSETFLMKHRTTENDEMQTSPRFRQPFVIPRQAAEAALPGEGALHGPVARGKSDEAMLGFRQLDHLERNAKLGCRFRSLPLVGP